MNYTQVAEYIQGWLTKYCERAGLNGFIVGISGGIDSALTSTLCALTGKEVLLVSMPIRQTRKELDRAQHHMKQLEARFDNVRAIEVDLTAIFEQFEQTMPENTSSDFLSMANARSRLRMTTLYAIGQSNGLLVAGTGNKVEDFGIGFFTKYGDGGVDLSPIADLNKTEVFAVARELGVIQEILDAKPTDGLWDDERTDEDHIGASYPELEWAMEFKGDESSLTEREREVLEIYRSYNRVNQHKMNPIPVCIIPDNLKG